MRRGLFDDAVSWLEAAAPKIATGSLPVQLRALKAAGLIAQFVRADPEQADRYWAWALAIAERLGEVDEITWIEDRRAGIDWERGDLELAARHFEARVERYRASGNRRGQADALHLLGENLRDLGRFDEAEAALDQADAIFRELGLEMGVATNTHSLADLALDRGDLETALRLYRESLALSRRLVFERNVAYSLAGIASVLAQSEQEKAAATIWGAICAAEDSLGFRMLTPERRRYERHLTPLEETPAWTAGKQLTLEKAVASLPDRLQGSVRGRQ